MVKCVLLMCFVEVAEEKAQLSVICNDQLVRVQRLDTRTNDYASFKVTVPAKLKAKLLSKKCWPEGANIRNFVDTLKIVCVYHLFVQQ